MATLLTRTSISYYYRSSIITLSFHPTSSFSPRQVRWSEFLQQFDYEIEYKPGKLNVAADALSRSEDFQPIDSKQSLNSLTEMVVTASDDLIRQVKAAYPLDPSCSDLLSNPRQHLRHYHIRDGLIFCGSQLYIPSSDEIKSQLMSEAHDSAVGGHLGVVKTMDALSRSFYWPKMVKDVKE